MSTKVRIDDGIFIEVDADGERPRGCQWDETVCTAQPTHRIAQSHEGHADHVHAEVYCGRHYALELARLVEVHLPGCDRDAAAHVAEFGMP